MKKLNMLILVDTLEVYGGAEKNVLELASYLNKDEYNLFISSLILGGELIERIRSCGVNVKLFPVKRIYSIFGIINGFRFVRFLKKNKIDVLMTIHFGSDIWGTIFGKIAGVPKIISNRRDIGFWRSKHHIFAYRLINKWVDTIIVNSHAGKKMVLHEEKVDEKKIRVIRNGIDIQEFKIKKNKKIIKQQLGIKEDKIIVGCIGNLKWVKGHNYLIEAAAGVVRDIPQAHFLLVGDGPLKTSLTSLAERLNVKEYITFLGSRGDIPDILSIMDICVLPSLSEGLSNAIMEYMAAGKPIIATRVGGNPELIKHNINGLLVEAGNLNQLEDAIIRLIRDRKKSLSLSLMAKKIVEKEFNIEKTIKKYEAVFVERRKKRILHLISSNGLFGAEKVLLNLARFNQQKEVDTIVAAIRNSHNPHIEIIEEARKMALKTAVFSSRGRIDIKTIIKIKKYINEQAIDILHTHNYKSDIVGFFVSRFTKTKWVATIHGWLGTERKLKLYEMIDMFVLNFANKVIAVSDEIKNDLLKKGIKGDKGKRIHNGINVVNFSLQSSAPNLKNEFGIDSKEVVVTTAGRLSPEKGHRVFLEAAEIIIRKRSNVKFLIVGDGPLLEELKSYTMNNGLKEKVIFTGVRDDILQIYSISDIYVNSSYSEGLPMTVLEAMGAHLPIVATRAGAIPQVISNGRNGILVDCGDVQGLANEIDSLISDRGKRQRLSKLAYKDVCEKFTLERMGQNYLEVYQEVLT